MRRVRTSLNNRLQKQSHRHSHEAMAAQDDSDMRTDTEIKEDVMKALTEVLAGDKDGNLTKTLEVNTSKDPSLIDVLIFRLVERH